MEAKSLSKPLNLISDMDAREAGPSTANPLETYISDEKDFNSVDDTSPPDSDPPPKKEDAAAENLQLESSPKKVITITDLLFEIKTSPEKLVKAKTRLDMLSNLMEYKCTYVEKSLKESYTTIIFSHDMATKCIRSIKNSEYFRNSDTNASELEKVKEHLIRIEKLAICWSSLMNDIETKMDNFLSSCKTYCNRYNQILNKNKPRLKEMFKITNVTPTIKTCMHTIDEVSTLTFSGNIRSCNEEEFKTICKNYHLHLEKKVKLLKALPVEFPLILREDKVSGIESTEDLSLSKTKKLAELTGESSFSSSKKLTESTEEPGPDNSKRPAESAEEQSADKSKKRKCYDLNANGKELLETDLNKNVEKMMQTFKSYLDIIHMENLNFSKFSERLLDYCVGIIWPGETWKSVANILCR